MPEVDVTPQYSVDAVPSSPTYNILPNLHISPTLFYSIDVVPGSPGYQIGGGGPSGQMIVAVSSYAAEVVAPPVEIVNGTLVMVPPPLSIDVVPSPTKVNYQAQVGGKVAVWSNVRVGPTGVNVQTWSTNSAASVPVIVYIWSNAQGGPVPVPVIP